MLEPFATMSATVDCEPFESEKQLPKSRQRDLAKLDGAASQSAFHPQTERNQQHVGVSSIVDIVRLQ